MEQCKNNELNIPKIFNTLNNSISLDVQNEHEIANVEITDQNKIETSAKFANELPVTVLRPGSNIKPKVNLEDVVTILRRLYGICGNDIKELVSYDDRNYLVIENLLNNDRAMALPVNSGYVLKVQNSLDSKNLDIIDAQNQLLLYLAKQNIRCPIPLANASGRLYSLENLSGVNHVVRLLTFIPGKVFNQIEITDGLIFESGKFLGQLDLSLKNFTHKAYETHKTLWMLQSISNIRQFVYVVKDSACKTMIEEIIIAFESKVLRNLSHFETQIIHGDYNEQNIIVSSEEKNAFGIIDFGDTSHSPILFEVGIAMAYMLLHSKKIENIGIFLAGYDSVRRLRETEKPFLKYCVAARIAQSLVMGLYTHNMNPCNEYVLVTQKYGWNLLHELWYNKFNEIDELWNKTASMYIAQRFI